MCQWCVSVSALCAAKPALGLSVFLLRTACATLRLRRFLWCMFPMSISCLSVQFASARAPRLRHHRCIFARARVRRVWACLQRTALGTLGRNPLSSRAPNASTRMSFLPLLSPHVNSVRSGGRLCRARMALSPHTGSLSGAFRGGLHLRGAADLLSEATLSVSSLSRPNVGSQTWPGLMQSLASGCAHNIIISAAVSRAVLAGQRAGPVRIHQRSLPALLSMVNSFDGSPNFGDMMGCRLSPADAALAASTFPSSPVESSSTIRLCFRFLSADDASAAPSPCTRSGDSSGRSVCVDAIAGSSAFVCSLLVRGPIPASIPSTVLMVGCSRSANR